jgi:hypothetical protein
VFTPFVFSLSNSKVYWERNRGEKREKEAFPVPTQEMGAKTPVFTPLFQSKEEKKGEKKSHTSALSSYFLEVGHTISTGLPLDSIGYPSLE